MKSSVVKTKTPAAFNSHSSALSSALSSARHNNLSYYSSDSSETESEVEYDSIKVQDLDGNMVEIAAESLNPKIPEALTTVPTTVPTTAPLSKPNFSNSKTPTLAKINTKPVRRKKGKIFATKDAMLRIVESANQTQDERIKEKIDRDVDYLKRQATMMETANARKAKKAERLERIKDNLRKGGVRVRGENKQSVRDWRKEKEALAKKSPHRKSLKTSTFSPNARKGKTTSNHQKKTVKFAE